MSIHHLQSLLTPNTIALVGASRRPGSMGSRVLINLIAAGFAGTVYAINPRPVDVQGAIWLSSPSELPEAPDLAIVMVPAARVPGVIAELGERGTQCAVVLSAGLNNQIALRKEMLEAARRFGMRIVGPNCLGIMAPHVGLDATFARTAARPGGLALISQSGALATAILDWADARGIGFSGMISVGDMADVDIGDLINLFAADPKTDVILLYVEGLSDAAKFMAAARSASVIKPIVAIKVGRSAEGAAAALSHSGALAGSYEVYRAAFDRAGVVTAETLTDLLGAAEVLSSYHSCDGSRLGIVTNGGGAGILAVDALGESRAELAILTESTLAELESVLPPTWSHAHPVDIVGDAGPDRYRAAIGSLLRDEGIDALLVINCPTAMASTEAFAKAVAEATQTARIDGVMKPVIGCWLGDFNLLAARKILSEAGIPLFATPEEAVRAFGHLLAATKARSVGLDVLQIQPKSSADIDKAKAIIAHARADDRELLDEVEAKELLAIYGIPVVPTVFLGSPEGVRQALEDMPPPYAVKIVSPDISHKSDVGGVMLGLATRELAAAAALAMIARIRIEHPHARIMGLAVEQMIEREHSHELFAGIANDPVFGPLILFGAGGTAVEVLADSVLTLPPVDDARARALIAATRISKLLAGYRREPAANVDAVASILCCLSIMAIDLPEIIELDINPLLTDPDGVVALDARVRISAEPSPAPRLVIQSSDGLDTASSEAADEYSPQSIRRTDGLVPVGDCS